MDDNLKGVVSSSGAVLEGLHLYLTVALSQEKLSADNDRSRRKFALQLGEFLGKLKAQGVLYAAPPRPGPKPGVGSVPSAGSIPGRKVSEPKPPVGHRKPVQQPQADEFYTDMTADHEQDAVSEEMYTDMDTNENPQAVQEEFYTDIDPQAAPQETQDEFYTDMDKEETTELEMYTDVDTANSGPQLKIEESVDSMDEDDHCRPGSSQLNGHDSLRAPSVSSNSSDSPYAEFTGAKFKKVKVSSLASSSKAGYMEKLGGYRHNKWQRRYCILDDICLFFFNSEKDKSQNNQLLLIDYEVSANVTEIKEKKKFLFKIQPLTENVQLKTYFFRVPTEQLRDEWVSAVAQACGKGAGMSKRKTILLQYHEQAETPPQIRSADPRPLSAELYEDASGVTNRPKSAMITPSNTSDESGSDTAATPVTKRKPQPPPSMEETKARGPPSSVSLTKRVEPLIDTHRIYYPDKRFNYSDVFVAVWDCRAGAANELSLQRGDLVLVVNKVNADWWYVTAQSDDDFKGKSGFVPSVYLDAAFEVVR